MADFDSIYVQVTLSGSADTGEVSVPVSDRVFTGREGEPTDQPPVANGGPDMVIHYPEESSVTLDGTLSTDDKVRQRENPALVVCGSNCDSLQSYTAPSVVARQ